MSIRSRRQAKSIAANNQIMNNQMFDLSSKLSDQMKDWKPNNEVVQQVQQSLNDDRTKFNKFTDEDKQAGKRINDLNDKLNNLNNMSFNGAFGTAKNLGLSEFTWKGKKYTTETREEQNKRLGISGGGANNGVNNPISNNGENSNLGKRTDRPTLVWGDLPNTFSSNASFINKNFNGQSGYNLKQGFYDALDTRGLEEHGYEGGNRKYITKKGAKKDSQTGKYRDEDIMYTKGAGERQWSRYVPSRRSGGKFPVFRNGGIIGLI